MVVTAQECKKIEAINIGEVRAPNRPEETEEYALIDEEENCVRNDNFRHEQSENDAENPENEEVFEDINETDEPITVLTDTMMQFK